ncbi:MAG: glycosyltransferase [Anaerolineae bacterium]|nr:glycosyltransferase [Anaerolineae bacterium]
MIAGETILCFAPDPWDDIWRNRHQIMSRLARQNLVIYVEPRPYLRQVWAGLRSGAIRPLRSRPRLRKALDNLYVYTPPLWAPISGREPPASLFGCLRRWDLRAAMRRLGAGRPILWLVRPDQSDVIGQFGEKMRVYQIVDDYTGYGGLTPERRAAFLERERRLIERVDMVFVTSPALMESKGGNNPRTYLVPNGVDCEAFSRALEDPSLPADLEALPRPRIGYVGALNDKVDYALLRDLARARPDWSIVLVGPWAVRGDATGFALRQEPNVHLLGKKDVALVPHYIKGLDICLMPYKLNEWTRSIDPLKMYEYLAAGRPVVSTPIPAAVAFAQWVSIADRERFAAAVEAAMAQDDETARAERRRVAAQHSWEARVEFIASQLAAFLQHET